MTVVGLIPARAGSKRLPGKNLADLGGRPLIAHTCEAALNSGFLTAVYVNTDSPEIAAAAAQAGVGRAIFRSAALARDDTPTRDVVITSLRALAERGEHYDAVMILQPTSPLRTADDIRAAWRLFEMHASCSVVSVSPVAPAHWLGRCRPDGEWERLSGAEPLHRLNGAIYIHSCAEYLAGRAPARTLAYPMPPARGVDIDTLEDLLYARALFARNRDTQV